MVYTIQHAVEFEGCYVRWEGLEGEGPQAVLPSDDGLLSQIATDVQHVPAFMRNPIRTHEFVKRGVQHHARVRIGALYHSRFLMPSEGIAA